MILTAMPDLPPRPETADNAAFRRWYVARWGRENAIVCGRCTQAEYPMHTQTLSIKTAWGGHERYLLPRRELVVDDDNYMVLNEGRTYASVLRSGRPTSSFSVFFRPGIAAEVHAARQQRLAAALDEPCASPVPAAFAEYLRPHDAAVTQRLRALGLWFDPLPVSVMASQFLLLFRGGDPAHAGFSPHTAMQQWGAWVAELRRDGRFVHGNPLAAGCPVLLHGGTVEIRPMFVVNGKA